MDDDVLRTIIHDHTNLLALFYLLPLCVQMLSLLLNMCRKKLEEALHNTTDHQLMVVDDQSLKGVV